MSLSSVAANLAATPFKVSRGYQQDIVRRDGGHFQFSIYYFLFTNYDLQCEAAGRKAWRHAVVEVLPETEDGQE